VAEALRDGFGHPRFGSGGGLTTPKAAFGANPLAKMGVAFLNFCF
jgi:hypothetical protein